VLEGVDRSLHPALDVVEIEGGRGH
jgi:hypothetical protein